jgi:multiple sugar transport system permease protein
MAEMAAPRAGTTHRKPWLSPGRREAITGYLFAAPFIVGFIALTVGPMLFSLYASFTKYNIVSAPRWIGLDNFRNIFLYDDRFRISLKNTVFYVIVKTPLVILVSLLLAMLLNIERLPFKRVFRTVFYMPTVLTGVAAVFLWVWVLNPSGLLNRGLAFLHIPGPNWFYDPAWSKPGLIVMSLWYIGAPMLIFLAGLNAIPTQLYEAAAIDGAIGFRRFWNITIPLLSPTIFYVVVTNIIGAFQVFTSAFIVSTTAGKDAGDPARSLLFYEVYLYERAFKSLEMGYACALAWILFVVVMAVTLAQLWLARRWVYYED